MRKIVGCSAGGSAAEGKYRIDAAYVRSIMAAGAIPIVLPSTADGAILEEALSVCDGVLLTGGPDIDPLIYGEIKKDECGDISAERDANELELCKLALSQNKPILAICRGVQVLNVACGGTLWQDIASQIENAVQHRTENGVKAEHNVIINDREILSSIPFEKEVFATNSFHHQAIKELGEGVCVMALSEEDRIVEGVYVKDKKFAVGVQWHPERLSDLDANAAVIFDAFVRAL